MGGPGPPRNLIGPLGGGGARSSGSSKTAGMAACILGPMTGTDELVQTFPCDLPHRLSNGGGVDAVATWLIVH